MKRSVPKVSNLKCQGMAFVHNQEWHFDNYDSVLWRPNWNVDKWLIHASCPCTQEWESSYISVLMLKDVSVVKQLREICVSSLSIQTRPYRFSREEKPRGRWKEGAEKSLSPYAKMLGLYGPLGTWLQLEILFLPSLSIHTLQLRSTMQALVAMVTGGARAAVIVGGIQTASGMWSDIKHAKLSLYFSRSVHLSLSVSEFTVEELKVYAVCFKNEMFPSFSLLLWTIKLSGCSPSLW